MFDWASTAMCLGWPEPVVVVAAAAGAMPPQLAARGMDVLPVKS